MKSKSRKKSRAGTRTRKSNGANEENGVSLYKRIKIDVTRMLSSGDISPNDPLPTEKQLAARFDVSIGTVRRAMDDLVAEHIVVRQQGRGTFLAALSPERMLNRFWPIFRQDGVRVIPIVQTLSFEESRADAEIAEALGLRKGDPIYRIVNLLLMGGNPVILDEINLSKKIYFGMREEDLVARETTMYGFYQSHFGINVFRVLDRLHGAVANQWSAERLAVQVNTPLLSVIRIAYAFGNKPVEFRKSLIRTDAYEYRNAVGGEIRVD
ncbi:MAG: GntR family transcriptional regulator [Rhizobiales bacterium]|jgi:GntR family transcriptional regulator|nr:GntR family transcriptional regulator [Hyphomicrobiales bacterium]